jgi:hypothetical protein
MELTDDEMRKLDVLASATGKTRAKVLGELRDMFAPELRAGARLVIVEGGDDMHEEGTARPYFATKTEDFEWRIQRASAEKLEVGLFAPVDDAGQYYAKRHLGVAGGELLAIAKELGIRLSLLSPRGAR